ncbi:MAG: hypothetical protein ACXU8U_08445, partial [Asticcacaulis sp.]
ASAIAVYASHVAALETSSNAPQELKCTEEGGLKGPYVPNAVVAENVFKAINNIKPNTPSSPYKSKVDVTDNGNYWKVELHTLIRTSSGQYQALQGASYWMDIDKCRATILKAATTR